MVMIADIYILKKLYKTKKGQWFLYSEGGESEKHGICWGEEIKDLTSKKALLWLKEKNHIGEISKHFPNYVITKKEMDDYMFFI